MNSSECMQNSIAEFYRDRALVVVEKPAGLLAVPGRGPEKQDCVLARVRAALPWPRGPMIVHRLDMATSGLMVVALEREAQRSLCRQFEQRTVYKGYEALLEGSVKTSPGAWHRIVLPFRLDPDNRPHQIYDPRHGKLGISDWRLLGWEGDRSRVQFLPRTGRTHQLRVHAADPRGIGIPIVGDRLYGSAEANHETRMCLHATHLEFNHPRTGVPLRFESPAPF